MDREDHLALLRGGLEGAGTVWADLGSGTGAFTLALADLLGPSARIHSVDRDARALAEQERVFRSRFPELSVRFVASELTAVPGLPPLDGAVAANSLHYVKDLPRALSRILEMLKPGGRLLVVEYEMEAARPWVPYPLPFKRLREGAAGCGFAQVRQLATRPSSFGRTVYSAAAERPGG